MERFILLWMALFISFFKVMPHYNLTICCHHQFYNDSDLLQSNQFETSWEKTKPPYYLITRENTHGNAQCETISFLFTSTSHTSTSSFNWTYWFISYRCTSFTHLNVFSSHIALQIVFQRRRGQNQHQLP